MHDGAVVPVRAFRFMAVAALCAASVSGCRERTATLHGAVARIAEQRTKLLPPLEKDKRRHDATVYVDGNPVAIVKFLELPAKLKPVWKTLDDGRRVRRYRMADYLEALGLALTSVKQVHVYGGRGRVGIIDATEIARDRDALLFSFTQGNKGKLRMNYPGRDRLRMTGQQVDIVDDIAVYRTKPPPPFDVRRGVLVDADNSPIVDIPYAPLERPGGTRIYVDGALVASIKRKTLPERVAVPGTTETGTTRFSLANYLALIGVDATRVRAIEAVADEEIASSLAQADIARLGALEFTMPRRSKGLIAIDDLAPGAKIEALLLHVKTSGIAQNNGSQLDHESADLLDNTGIKTAARTVH